MNETIAVYLDKLASNAPTPGGGAVAALTGAQAAALVSMVCELTRGNDPETARAIEDAAAAAKKAVSEFQLLAEKDAAAFGELMQTYRLAKSSEEEKRHRRAAIQKSLRAAAEPPLRVAVLASDLAPMLDTLHQMGNPNLITDVGIAALLVPATIEAAAMNVEINLRSISDDTFAQDARNLINASRVCIPAMHHISSSIAGQFGPRTK